MNPDARVQIDIGWSEVQAVYRMSAGLTAARRSRDAAKTELRRAQQIIKSKNADVEDFDLLNDRAVLSLLVEVERAMSGKEQRAEIAFRTHNKLKALIGRAKKRKNNL